MAFFGKLMLISFAVGVVTGHHPGVPVRHELVAVLALRRRHLRRAARDGGRSLAFFLESTFLGLWIFGRGRVSPRCTSPRSGSSRSGRRSRRSSSSPRTRGCSTPSATRSVDGKPQLDDIWRGRLDQRPRCARLPARAPRRADDRRARRRSPSAPGSCAAATRSQLFSRAVKRRAADACAVGVVGDVPRRRRLDAPAGQAAADEDRRGRGAVRDRGAGGVLPLRDRRLHAPTPGTPTATSRSRTCCRCSRPARGTARSQGINQIDAQYQREVRARASTSPYRRGHLLVVPRHGLHVGRRCCCSPRIGAGGCARKGTLARARGAG